jgi:hypothetical protein
MTKTNDRTIYDVDEEQISFISQFLIDLAKAIDPNITEDSVQSRLTALELPNGKYEYFLDKKFPLLSVDLNLLIDGT